MTLSPGLAQELKEEWHRAGEKYARDATSPSLEDLLQDFAERKYTYRLNFDERWQHLFESWHPSYSDNYFMEHGDNPTELVARAWIAEAKRGWKRRKWQIADADFIAHAPEELRWAVSEIVRLEKESNAHFEGLSAEMRRSDRLEAHNVQLQEALIRAQYTNGGHCIGCHQQNSEGCLMRCWVANALKEVRP